MLEYIIPLLSSLLTSSFIHYFFFPILALAIVATIPVIIRAFVRR